MVAGTGPGSNSVLTDEEQKALFLQHKRAFAAGLDKFKKAQAELRNLGKKAKAECGEHAVDRIKLAILLEGDNGEAEQKKLQERMERDLEVARWMGLPVGAQASLFDVDRRPSGERAREDGKRAGMEGADRKVPAHWGHPDDQEWLQGYAEGQAVIFNIAEKKGAPVMRGTQTPGTAAPDESEADDAPETDESEGADADGDEAGEE